MSNKLKYHWLIAVYAYFVLTVVNIENSILFFGFDLTSNVIFLYLTWISPLIIIYYFVSKDCTKCFQEVYINYYYRLKNRKYFYKKILKNAIILIIFLSTIRYLVYYIFTKHQVELIDLIMNFVYFNSIIIFLCLLSINLYIKSRSDKVLTFVLLMFLVFIGSIVFVFNDYLYLITLNSIGIKEIVIVNVLNVLNVFVGCNFIEKEYLY